MTPNELYAIPPRSVCMWYDDYHDSVEDVLDFDHLDGSEPFEEKDTGRFEIHEKLYYSEDSERCVIVEAMYFDGRPFALMFAGGRGARDSRTPVVTDEGLWAQAREYVLSIVNADPVFQGRVAEPDKDLTDGYYGARLVRLGEEVRLVSSDDVSPISGNLVYDRAKFDERFEGAVRPLGDDIGYENGLADPRMMAAAIDAFRAGIVGRHVPLDIDLDGRTKIVAASETEGQTFAHVLDSRGGYYSWKEGLSSCMVGPESLFECYADIAAGRPVSAGCRYVGEAAEAFGADPGLVHAVLTDFLHEGGKSVAERIVEAMPRDERVPEELTVGYSSFAIGFMVRDNPGLRRFLDRGYPDEVQAEELIAKADELSKRIASGELKRPGM